MTNTLFSSNEIKKLKKHIKEQKANCISKAEEEPYNSFYKVLQGIENKNMRSENNHIKILK